MNTEEVFVVVAWNVLEYEPSDAMEDCESVEVLASFYKREDAVNYVISNLPSKGFTLGDQERGVWFISSNEDEVLECLDGEPLGKTLNGRVITIKPSLIK